MSQTNKNQTAYLIKEREIVLKDSDMPKLLDDECIIKVETVTICGSDTSFFIDPTYGGTIDPPVLPIVLGHECSGTIVEVGKDVTHLKTGDKVAIEPGVGCGTCEYCLSGRYNLCRKMDFMAAYPFNRGALSKYISHPAKALFKIPDDMSTIEGALMEPLSVGLHAVQRAQVEFGDTAIVIGCGCIGLMTIISLKANGVNNIIATDFSDARLKLAKKLGATKTFNGKTENYTEIINETGAHADLVFETAGSAIATAQTVDIVKPGGKIITVGNIHGETPFRFLKTNDNEVNIISVFRYVNSYPTAIAAVENKIIENLEDMITDTFTFEKTQQAFELAAEAKEETIKIAIQF